MEETFFNHHFPITNQLFMYFYTSFPHMICHFVELKRRARCMRYRVCFFVGTFRRINVQLFLLSKCASAYKPINQSIDQSNRRLQVIQSINQSIAYYWFLLVVLNQASNQSKNWVFFTVSWPLELVEAMFEFCSEVGSGICAFFCIRVFWYTPNWTVNLLVRRLHWLWMNFKFIALVEELLEVSAVFERLFCMQMRNAKPLVYSTVYIDAAYHVMRR